MYLILVFFLKFMKMIRHPRRKSLKPLHALPICHADFGLYEFREYLLFPFTTKYS